MKETETHASMNTTNNFQLLTILVALWQRYVLKRFISSVCWRISY